MYEEFEKHLLIVMPEVLVVPVGFIRRFVNF